MKTSTYELSTSQKWMFPILLILAMLFAGCSENPGAPDTSEESDAVSSSRSLESEWIELSRKGQKSQAVLSMTQSSGRYEVSSEDNSSVELIMLFEYSIKGGNNLSITKTRHVVNGNAQPAGETEDVFYSLSGNILRIFDRTFVREGVDTDDFIPIK